MIKPHYPPLCLALSPRVFSVSPHLIPGSDQTVLMYVVMFDWAKCTDGIPSLHLTITKPYYIPSLDLTITKPYYIPSLDLTKPYYILSLYLTKRITYHRWVQSRTVVVFADSCEVCVLSLQAFPLLDRRGPLVELQISSLMK